MTPTPALAFPPADWTIHVSSPFRDVQRDNPASGARVMDDLFPDLAGVLRSQLQLLEALLFPSAIFPARRVLKDEKHLVVVLDDFEVCPASLGRRTCLSSV